MAAPGKGEVKIPISLPGAAQAAADAGKVAAGLKQVETATENVAQASSEATSATNGTSAATRANVAENRKLEQSNRAAAASTKAQGDAAKETGSKILSLGETTEKGIGIGRLASEVTNGNYVALFNLTSILKVTGAALKTNLIGILALAVTGLGSFIAGLASSRKSLQETGNAADAAGRQVDAFAQVAFRFDRLKRELAEVRKEFDGITEQTRAMRAAMDALDDARLGVEIASLDRQEADALSQPGITADQKRVIGQDFEMRRTAARQAAAMTRTRDEAQRVSSDLETNAAGQQQAVDQQASLALAETQVKKMLDGQIENLARVQALVAQLEQAQVARQAYDRESKIPFAGSAARGGGLRRRPDAPPEIDPETIKRVREEEAAILQQVQGGQDVLKNIREERKGITARSTQLGREAEVLKVRQQTAKAQEEMARQRAEAEAVSARAARQETNRAAVDQSMAEWKERGFAVAPSPTQPVAPISPTLQGLGLGGGAPGMPPAAPVSRGREVRDAASLREEQNALALRGPSPEALRSFESKVNEMSRNMMNSPGKDYDRIAALLLSLSDAMVMKDLKEKASRDRLEAQIQRIEAQIKAGAGNR